MLRLLRGLRAFNHRRCRIHFLQPLPPPHTTDRFFFMTKVVSIATPLMA
jgi:hypothetical protein